MAFIGILRRLRKDATANMMAIGAAAIIPLIGVVGGGVDASRMYLAQSRLQQSCDAATLAARKKLAGGVITDGVIPTDIETQADNFFAANFPAGQYGTTNVEYELTAGGETQMNGAASAKVPATLMKVFGYSSLDISVTCSADLNLPNIDVALVLDNSGSMRNSRIEGLKTAVESFYDEVMAAKDDGARVRIALVPYSNTVNVGSLLMAADTDFIKDSHTYQSREAQTTDLGNSTELLPRSTSQLGSSNSSHYHWNANASNHRRDCLAYNGTYTVGDETWTITNATWLPAYWAGWPNNQKAACSASVHKERFTYVYKPIEFDTSDFKAGNSVTTATGTRGANVSSSWDGCIEERKTVQISDYSSIPSSAYDLDIDLVPDSSDPDTQWAPFWPDVTFDRAVPANVTTTSEYDNNYHYDCPAQAYKLQEWPLNGADRNAAFESAVDAMVASGYTMHDIGLIWGARLLSPDGIFASDNATAPNGDTISRHLIFMTDGLMEPGPSAYHAYGDYDMEGRIAGFAADGTWSTTDIAVHHNSRMALLCEAIKNKNITIWTVAFGLPHTTYTQNCATGGATRAFTAANNAQLNNAFKQIAASIAELRLVN